MCHENLLVTKTSITNTPETITIDVFLKNHNGSKMLRKELVQLDQQSN